MDGHTWLVCPGHPGILLTNHLPDGTKVRGDEIVLEPQYYLSKSDEWIYDTHPEISKRFKLPTRQVATLKHPDSYRERKVVEDLEMGDLWFSFFDNDIQVYYEGENIYNIDKTELQALKSWINKIEL